jgi:uncharacterized DUF497 family protein
MDEPPLRIDRLQWDDWNREHIAKHGVTPEEADEVLASEPVVRKTYKERYQLLGPTRSGRILSVIVGQDPEPPHSWYVFSARPASRRERQTYKELRKEGDNQ